MGEIWFYHLERQPLEQVLPRIIAGMHARGDRVSIHAGTKAVLEDLSNQLWALEDTSFVPHGFDPREAIWFSCESDTPNEAPFRIVIGGAPVPEMAAARRTSIFFDGNDAAATDHARDQWKSFRAEGHVVRYWKQDSKGRWEDQAA